MYEAVSDRVTGREIKMSLKFKASCENKMNMATFSRLKLSPSIYSRIHSSSNIRCSNGFYFQVSLLKVRLPPCRSQVEFQLRTRNQKTSSVLIQQIFQYY